VIGAMRAATTTLHRHLVAHPEIAMAREKETDFFVEELNFPRGLRWYGELFPAGPGLRGECSPNYTKFDAFPGVPRRIRQHVPNCRLIFVARDPVARALSHFRFASNRLAPGERITPERWRHIITTSRYHAQLSRYLEHFERDRLLILDFAEVSGDPAAALRRIGGFLGLTEDWPPTTELAINSADELARLPDWFFRLRRSRLVSDARRALPRPLIDRVRRAIASGPAREVADPDADTVARLHDCLREDVARFRALAGLPFPDWPF
jgi:hypothetical protein